MLDGYAVDCIRQSGVSSVDLDYQRWQQFVVARGIRIRTKRGRNWLGANRRKLFIGPACKQASSAVLLRPSGQHIVALMAESPAFAEKGCI